MKVHWVQEIWIKKKKTLRHFSKILTCVPKRKESHPGLDNDILDNDRIFICVKQYLLKNSLFTKTLKFSLCSTKKEHWVKRVEGEQIMTELLLTFLAISIKFGLFDFTFFLVVTVFLYFSILHISLIPKFDTLPNLTNFAALDHSRLKALKSSRMILNSGKYVTVPYVRQVHFSGLVNGRPLWHLQKL